MNYAIIGAGPAGVVAAETLRQVDPDGSITLIGDEDRPPYSRMAIPYFLVGNIEESGTYLRPEDTHYRSQNITVKNSRVAKVDSSSQVVHLGDGSEVAYDRLLVATGARPLRPPIDGLDLDGVQHCWTLRDARGIIQRATEGSDVVLLGAGFIGCIIMEALAGRGVNLTVVEMGDRMVPRMMDPVAGGMIARWCDEKGVKVRTSTRIEKIESGSGRLSVSLSNGETLPANLVVVAAGVTPNTEFLEGSGVAIDDGILVDRHMRSSSLNIFAAGDVARGIDFSTGGHDVHAIQPTATEHGRVAALNMAGIDTEYQGSLNMNVLDTLGLISSSFGLWMGVDGGESTNLVDENAYRYLNLQFKGDLLVGASALGYTEQVGILRGLIQSQMPLGEWKAALMDDPSRFVEAYVALSRPD